ncbi:phage tail tape measure protein [Piscinibacter sp.]|uniref:phage tail tape measure protein n=1 Tax=Piscinibacter sp. TaxID=1903157 RepID=UPI0039E5C6E9
MVAGSIVISLLAATGSFITDMKRSEKALRELRKEAVDAGRKIGLGISAVGVATAYMVKQQIDAADAAGKAAQAAGVSVDTYTALAYAAELSGVEAAGLSTALRELNKSLVSNDPAFKQLGVSIRDSSGNLKASERVLAEVADRFSAMPDGPKKAALAIELFGKAGTDLIPLLNSGSAGIGRLTEEAKRLGVVIDDETAKAAEELNDNLSRLKKSGEGLALQLAKEVTPTLVELSDHALKNARDFGILRGSFMALYEVILGGAEPADMLEKQSKTTSDSIKGLRAEIEKLTARGVGENFQGGVLGQLRQRLAEEEARAKTITQELNDALNAAAGRTTFGRGVGFTDPRLPKPPTPDDPKKHSAITSEAQRYLETLQKQVEETLDLTTYEKALLDIQEGRIKGLTPAMEKAILAQAEFNDLNKQAIELREAEVAGETARGRAQLDSLESLMKGNAELRREIDLFGLDELGLLGVERARISSTRALKEEELARQEAAGVTETQLQALQQEIDLLREREGLLGQRIQKGIDQKAAEEAKRTGDEASSALAYAIERGLLDGFHRGADLNKIFLNEMKAQFAKTVLRPRINFLVEESNKLIAMLIRLAISALLGNDSGFGTGAGYGSMDIGGFLASGGPAAAGTAYVVGEKGPELFVPNTAGRVIPNDALGRGDMKVVVNAPPGTTVARQSQIDSNTLEVWLEMADQRVARGIASGGGATSRALQGRGIRQDAALARRG